MKKILFAFLLLNIASIQYCANFDINEILIKGKIEQIDKITLDNMHLLIELNQEELALLKNFIYARHGYIFEDKKLITYFKKFNWYKPDKRNINQDLSYNERIIITFICELEKRIFIHLFTKKDYEKIIIAEWIENFQAPGGIVNEYRFEKDYFFEYISKLGTCYIAGEWKIEDLKIYIKPGFIKYWEKEFIIKNNGLSLPAPDRENNKIIEKKLSVKEWIYIGSFTTFRFPRKLENIDEELITPISLTLPGLKIINDDIRLTENFIFYRGEFSQFFEID